VRDIHPIYPELADARSIGKAERVGGEIAV
jgi:hypothetical protein